MFLTSMILTTGVNIAPIAPWLQHMTELYF